MHFELTAPVFDELWKESEQRGQAGCEDTETEAVDWAILPHIGRFWQCSMPIQEGLELSTQEWEMLGDLRSMDPGMEAVDETVGFGFYLSGRVITQLQGLTDEIEEPIGYYDFCSCIDVAETETWYAGEPFHRLYVGIDPFQLFSDCTPAQHDQLPQELQQILEGNRVPFVRYGVITPAIYQVLQQILHCPYEGIVKRFYLQSKTLELLVLALVPFGHSTSPIQSQSLRPREIESIYQARHLLLQHLDAPPALEELAQQVHLNAFALKQGFQKVFGTTPFRYLHDHRLEVARQLLATDALSVTKVAKRVGFAHRGYFARAFRKKFGFSPKACRLQQRNTQ
jgi:AraC family transcriptional regulator, transcriptional activator of the genes for pyochelin and ferripyochelin receptors